MLRAMGCGDLEDAAHKMELSCPKYICDQVAWVPTMLNSSAVTINR